MEEKRKEQICEFQQKEKEKEIREMKLQGIKHMRLVFMNLSGRGASYASRSGTERSRGLHRRENAGMSNEMCARNTQVESPRFPGEGSSAQGKSGPKPRTKIVGDGQLVEIPVPPLGAKH